MSETVVIDPGGIVAARLDALDTELLATCFAGMPADDLLRHLVAVETHTRRMVAVQNAIVASLERQHVAQDSGFRSTGPMLSQLLLIGRGEAFRRVRDAREFGPRQEFAGLPLEPEYPIAAAALARGDISVAHARVVSKTVRELPRAVRAVEAEHVEAYLVEQATGVEPGVLAQQGQAITAVVDPDGIEPRYEDVQRKREFYLRRHADGTSEPCGYFTPELTEAVLTMLDATAAPAAADQDGIPDLRSPEQRQHDGLYDGILAALRAVEVPSHHGAAAAITFTVDHNQLAAYRAACDAGGTSADRASAGGMVTTGHGVTMPLAAALRMCGADTEIIPMLTVNDRPVVLLDGAHRLATALQRRILAHRDGGCSFPGCTVTPSLCQTHHVTDYQITGHTDIDDLTLLCGFHHRTFEAQGWTCEVVDHEPRWTPPPWLDPEQRPRRNTSHRTVHSSTTP